MRRASISFQSIPIHYCTLHLTRTSQKFIHHPKTHRPFNAPSLHLFTTTLVLIVVIPLLVACHLISNPLHGIALCIQGISWIGVRDWVLRLRSAGVAASRSAVIVQLITWSAGTLHLIRLVRTNYYFCHGSKHGLCFCRSWLLLAPQVVANIVLNGGV